MRMGNNGRVCWFNAKASLFCFHAGDDNWFIAADTREGTPVLAQCPQKQVGNPQDLTEPWYFRSPEPDTTFKLVRRENKGLSETRDNEPKSKPYMHEQKLSSFRYLRRFLYPDSVKLAPFVKMLTKNANKWEERKRIRAESVRRRKVGLAPVKRHQPRKIKPDKNSEVDAEVTADEIGADDEGEEEEEESIDTEMSDDEGEEESLATEMSDDEGEEEEESIDTEMSEDEGEEKSTATESSGDEGEEKSITTETLVEESEADDEDEEKPLASETLVEEGEAEDEDEEKPLAS